jgi:hypothetical protein
VERQALRCEQRVITWWLPRCFSGGWSSVEVAEIRAARKPEQDVVVHRLRLKLTLQPNGKNTNRLGDLHTREAAVKSLKKREKGERRSSMDIFPVHHMNARFSSGRAEKCLVTQKQRHHSIIDIHQKKKKRYRLEKKISTAEERERKRSTPALVILVQSYSVEEWLEAETSLAETPVDVRSCRDMGASAPASSSVSASPLVEGGDAACAACGVVLMGVLSTSIGAADTGVAPTVGARGRGDAGALREDVVVAALAAATGEDACLKSGDVHPAEA